MNHTLASDYWNLDGTQACLYLLCIVGLRVYRDKYEFPVLEISMGGPKILHYTCTGEKLRLHSMDYLTVFSLTNFVFRENVYTILKFSFLFIYF